MTLPPEARAGLERAWLQILRERHPDVTWRIARRELVIETEDNAGRPINVYLHPNAGYQIYHDGWRIATRKTKRGATAVVERAKTRAQDAAAMREP